LAGQSLKKGWFVTWQPTLTADWEATNGGRWVVPFGGGVGRIMPACLSYRTVLWQCRSSSGGFALGHAVANCVPISEVVQGNGADDVGEKNWINCSRNNLRKIEWESKLEVNREVINAWGLRPGVGWPLICSIQI